MSINHYLTKYWEGDVHYAEAWIQLDLLGRCFCFARKKIELGGGSNV